MASSPSLTEPLRLYSEGHLELGNSILSEISPRLRQIATWKLAKCKPWTPATPTELIGDTWLTRLQRGNWSIESREHFFSIAGQAIQQVLIDLARKQLTERRGGGAVHISLDEMSPQRVPTKADAEQLVAIGMLIDSWQKKMPWPPSSSGRTMSLVSTCRKSQRRQACLCGRCVTGGRRVKSGWRRASCPGVGLDRPVKIADNRLGKRGYEPGPLSRIEKQGGCDHFNGFCREQVPMLHKVAANLPGNIERRLGHNIGPTDAFPSGLWQGCRCRLSHRRNLLPVLGQYSQPFLRRARCPGRSGRETAQSQSKPETSVPTSINKMTKKSGCGAWMRRRYK